MAGVANKLRKGDYCAVVVEHSSTPLKGPIERYTRLVLAQVAKASRDGVVERVVFAGSAHSVELARVGKCFALTKHQVQARRLFVATTRPGTDYVDKDEFAAALNAAVDTVAS
jgi:hypothetical protein